MNPWPKLEYETLNSTHRSLHMWMQIVGKFRLANSPWLNHSWQATLYLNSSGLTTALIPGQDRDYEISFDFHKHQLKGSTSDQRTAAMPLTAMSVADFYQGFIQMLEEMGAPTKFHMKPNELPDPVAFDLQKEILSYDPEIAHAFWQALLRSYHVFHYFRSGFLGKVSPVHLFWGSADLAVTRFSGRTAPLHPGGVPALPDDVSREAYSHEVSSAGFWAGSGVGYPAYYAYAYPTPEGFGDYQELPQDAFFHKDLGEFILPYSSVQSADHPEKMLLEFLQGTYQAAADLGRWDRGALECEYGKVGIPRKLHT